MTVNAKIIDEKLQCDINRETSKLSALSSGKIDKCEYLTCEDILPVDESPIKEQDNLSYSLLGKSFEKQKKKRQLKTKKQFEALKVLKPTEQKLTIKDAIPEG